MTVDPNSRLPFPSQSVAPSPPFIRNPAISSESQSTPSTLSSSWSTAPGPNTEAIRRGSHDHIRGRTPQQVQDWVKQWSPEISRNGLTSATLLRDLAIASPLALPTEPAHPSPLPSAATPKSYDSSFLPPPTPPPYSAYTSKRRISQGNVPGAALGPPPKRARLSAPGELDFRDLPSAATDIAPPEAGLVSPLFFSKTGRQRKTHMHSRPVSFAGPSEAAVAAMAKMQDDSPDGGTVTVSLPRGTVSDWSPGRSRETPGSWASFGTKGQPGTPGSRTSPGLPHALQGVGIVELLEQDERPTFIIDLADKANYEDGPLQIVYMNASLRASHGVSQLIHADMGLADATADCSRFKSWALSFVKDGESMNVVLPSVAYGGITWTCSTLRRQFRFISGSLSAVSITPTSPGPAAAASHVLEERARGPTPQEEEEVSDPMRFGRPSSETDYFGNASHTSDEPRRALSEPREGLMGGLAESQSLSLDDALAGAAGSVSTKPSFDWTRIPLSTPGLPEHIRFARSIDWAATPLGPIESWHPDLRMMSNMIMGSPHPAAMYWGPEFIAIYNEAYITLAGAKHPAIMGLPYSVGWAEIWDVLEPMLMDAWNGKAIMKHDDRLYIVRDGLEEAFFNWSLVPLVGGDGSVVALYNPAFENTRRKVNERRMLALREILEQTSQARDVNHFWQLVLKGLEYNEFDVPFALLYSISAESESDASSDSLNNPPQLNLEGSLGAPAGHRAAVPFLDLKTTNDGFAPYMKEAMEKQTPVVLRQEDGTLPTHLIDGLQWRGFGDPCRTIVVFPVHPTAVSASVAGFIVMGANPRRPYDDDFQLFVQLLSRQLATSLAAVVLFEEEIRRGQRAARLAALDRQELSLQLRIKSQEALESEYKFSKMAQFAPVGMFIADDKGVIDYCNDMWWQISRHPRENDDASTNSNQDGDTWMDSIKDEDKPGVRAVWSKLVNDNQAISHEFRFKRPGSRRQADGGSPGGHLDTWVLLAAQPEKKEDGSLKRIFGCITDISQQKWAEEVQSRRREEAVELKRQQENFIDITSHEMRNPLSAVLQCADEISGSIARYRVDDPASYEPGRLNMLLDSCLEASNTISLCAAHQKRIVDDILTLSKLDSQLLLVTPVDVQPVAVVRNVLKMFETELNSNGVRGEFRLENSYRRLAIDWVKLDPSRLRQVLINLMTNAIKFTRAKDGNRSVTISLGASSRLADYDRPDVAYFSSKKELPDDPTDEEDWGTGEKINLHLAVTDTGPGLTPDEKKLLFQRFSQASPRTHVQYGGSGLGLFISRILTELQGGQIGVTSEAGVGSTFAFYIRARKATDPLPSARELTAPAALTTSNTVSGETLQFAVKGSVDGMSLAGSQEDLYRTRSRAESASSKQGYLGGGGAGGKSGGGHGETGYDVLIVEDNLVNQKVLQRQLRINGNATHVANHGGEALEALKQSRYWNRAHPGANQLLYPEQAQQQQPPASPARRPQSNGASTSAAAAPDGKDEELIDINVILMDLEMPVMDGMTCARRIRELEREGVLHDHVPIIAVTAYARPEQIADAKAAGIDDVISKPFRIPDLMPKIEELVKRYGAPSAPTAPSVAA